MIRLTIPSIEEDDLEAVCEVLRTGYLVQGPRVAEFERVVADYVGCKHAVAVSSCTSALHLSLLALNVSAGDLVVVTAYSWIATANVVELCGAQPVFVDIHPGTFNMDPGRLEATLDRLMSDSATACRVRAILPVHTFGQLADMPAILNLASQYGLPVVEDAACALGGTVSGRQAGTWGVMGCFSFHPRKAVTTGEGGIVTTDNTELARRLRTLRNHGLDADPSVSDFVVPGFNYRMTDFQAALGVTQMAKLDRILDARRELAARYSARLAGSSVQVPVLLDGAEPTFQSYVIELPDSVGEARRGLMEGLKLRGVEATIGTCHMPLAAYYRTRYGYAIGDFPVTDQVSRRSLTLPLYERMSGEEQDHVVDALLACLAS